MDIEGGENIEKEEVNIEKGGGRKGGREERKT